MPGSSRAFDLLMLGLMSGNIAFILWGNVTFDNIMLVITAMVAGLYLGPLLEWLGVTLRERTAGSPRPDQEGVQLLMTFWMDGADKQVETMFRGSNDNISSDMMTFLREKHEEGVIGEEVMDLIQDRADIEQRG